MCRQSSLSAPPFLLPFDIEPDPLPVELPPADPLPLLDEAPLAEPLDDVPEPPFEPLPLLPDD